MANNIVTYGLRNVHYSIVTLTPEGTYTFGTPVEFKGAQEFTSDVVGGSTTVRADDIIVAQLNSNSGRTLSLKVTEVPESFKTDVLGYKKTSEGNLVEITNAPTVTFSLGCEFQGDQKARRVWYFLCSVAPINESSKTKGDTIEANTVTLNITVRPVKLASDDYTTHVIAAKGDTNYETFLTKAPVLPTFPTVGVGHAHGDDNNSGGGVGGRDHVGTSN